MDDQKPGEEIQVVVKVELAARGSQIKDESVKIKLPPGIEVTPQKTTFIRVKNFRPI